MGFHSPTNLGRRCRRVRRRMRSRGWQPRRGGRGIYKPAAQARAKREALLALRAWQERGSLVIVVKVGGSLFDHPRLGPGLRAYLDSLAPAEVLLVPGGGDFADAVRKLDRIHGLGEEASHQLALRTLTITAAFLEQLLMLGE